MVVDRLLGPESHSLAASVCGVMVNFFFFVLRGLLQCRQDGQVKAVSSGVKQLFLPGLV
jgi:hypothetical protein